MASLSLTVLVCLGFLLLLNSVLEDYIFLEICPFHPSFHILGIQFHILVHSNFLIILCISFFFLILCISVLSVLISSLSFLILFIWVLSFFFFISLVKGLSILFIFSNNQLLDLLILWIVLLVSMSLNSALILVISFLLLSVGFVVPLVLVDLGLGCLFEIFLSFRKGLNC